MGDPFESAWLRWCWGVLHAHELYADYASFAWQGTHEYKVRREYDAKCHCVILRIASFEDLPVEWSLRLGDVIHNYRSCLDHIAWTLVGRGRATHLTPGKEKRVYFPIYGDRVKFNSSLKDKLPGVRRADIAIVRRYQPYHRRAGSHAFALLDELSNKDKHRNIRPVLFVPAGAEITIGRIKDCTITRIPESTEARAMEVDAEIYRIYVRRTGPYPDIEMKSHVAIAPALEGGFPLSEWLQSTRWYCYKLLSEFSATPHHHLDALGVSRFLDIP